MPEKDDKPTDVYHSFQEFCQQILKLKLPVGWSINISEFTYMKKYDNIHDLPEFEIVVDLNLAFKIQTFALFVPPDHDIYTIYKTPDPKCKLIISSFLTLPHLLDCLICVRNAMPIVLLLQMMGGWDRWGVVDLY